METEGSSLLLHQCNVWAEFNSLASTRKVLYYFSSSSCERYLAEFHFSEGITQELVSIQIAIQSEVAASNSHAKKLFADINNIKTFFVEATNSKVRNWHVHPIP